MAILMRIQVTGGTTAQYDRTNEILGISSDSDAPEGLVSHVCGVTGDGILIVDVWDSEEALNSFYESRLSGALREAGVPESRPEIMPLHKILSSENGAANVIMMIEFAAGTDVYDRMAALVESHRAGAEHPWVSHAAGAKPDGGMLIVDLWDSAEAFGEFAQEQLVPAAAQVAAASGHELPPIEPTFIPVHNYFRGRVEVTAG